MTSKKLGAMQIHQDRKVGYEEASTDLGKYICTYHFNYNTMVIKMQVMSVKPSAGNSCCFVVSVFDHSSS